MDSVSQIQIWGNRVRISLRAYTLGKGDIFPTSHQLRIDMKSFYSVRVRERVCRNRDSHVTKTKIAWSAFTLKGASGTVQKHAAPPIFRGGAGTIKKGIH